MASSIYFKNAYSIYLEIPNALKCCVENVNADSGNQTGVPGGWALVVSILTSSFTKIHQLVQNLFWETETRNDIPTISLCSFLPLCWWCLKTICGEIRTVVYVHRYFVA